VALENREVRKPCVAYLALAPPVCGHTNVWVTFIRCLMEDALLACPDSRTD
jgi:hypothetical protein